MPASFTTDRTEDGSISTTQMRSHGISTFVTRLTVEHASSTESLPKARTSASLSAPLRASGRVCGNESFLSALNLPKNLLRRNRRRLPSARYWLEMENLVNWCWPTPLSEPNVHLSMHSALGLTKP